MTGLQVKNLNTDIFEHLTFDFPKSGLFGIIGRNGVGKSTLFTIINGEMKLTEGSLSAGKIAYLPNLDVFDTHLTANDYLKLLSPKERVIFQKNLDRMGGASFLKKKVGKYSLGMKELFAFLYLLSLQGDVIILDELLDGLDEQRRFAAYDLLKEKSHDKLILLTSHNLSEVFKICDSVYLLERRSLSVVNSLDEAHGLISL